MWTMSKHSAGQYNDPEYYTIIDENGKRIADLYASFETVNNIVNAHNQVVFKYIQK